MKKIRLGVVLIVAFVSLGVYLVVYRKASILVVIPKPVSEVITVATNTPVSTATSTVSNKPAPQRERPGQVTTQEITEQNVFNGINQVRYNLGLKILKRNSVLDAVAQERLNDMFDKHYYNHTSPTGEDFIDALNHQGYAYSYGGENLAIGTTIIQDVVNNWISSPDHFNNIRGNVQGAIDAFTETGIAIRKGSPLPCLEAVTYKPVVECVLVVQIFGTPK